MQTTLAPLHGQLVQWCVQPGQAVRAGDVLVILESMKMEHEVTAAQPGRVRELLYAPGETVEQGAVLLELDPPATASPPAAATTDPGPAGPGAGGPRDDLRRVLERHAFTEDARRPQAMARRHARGLRSGRENVQDLCDPGSFDEYGALAVAAQGHRRPLDELVAQTPADGLITGTGSVNGEHFGAERSRTAVMAYDATVLAGTQGKRGHQKATRLLDVAWRHRLPLVLFAEGGGGRPGDDELPVVAGLHMATFANFVRLNGHVPLVGITAGRCFAGNASLLGCCDVVIATRDCNIGMGGPAMIEGGGLGRFEPEQIGPAVTQHANGVIDVLVDDEAQAVRAARHYLSFFQGPMTEWTAPDALALRDAIPENRLRAYDSRHVLAGLVDAGSLLELRTGFGRSLHTALARIEGRPVGLLVSNPLHLGGAIDADAADKAARFMQLCSNFGIALISLVDTPGFMVGPEIEERAQVRHTSRMFIAASHLRVSFASVILRKAYGLGAMALTAGSFHAPSLTASWPTGEFGGMGIEGHVRLGYRRELEALPSGEERDALFERLVRERYEAGSAISMAMGLEIDAVIDPAQTRHWLTNFLRSATRTPATPAQPGVDAW